MNKSTEPTAPTMTLDLPALGQLALNAAQQAGAIIDQYRNQNVVVERKAGRDSEAAQVVTEVDHQAQRIIVDMLKPTLDQYDLALLAEESADDGRRLDKAAFWCIDPMDGTLAFTRGIAGFSVSIALVANNGEPLVGVVYDPVNKDSYHAHQGAGAFKNNRPIRAAALNPDLPLVLCTDISFKSHPRLQPTLEGLQTIAARLGLPGATIDFRIGAVMNAICALTNPNICYFKYARSDSNGGSIWDYAATACLFQQAQGIACDIHGQPMDLNRPNTTFMNHRGIVYSPDLMLAQEIIALNRRLDEC
jgi:fructose-1,6-bisphosphatase/inositol monophosphatase family enzyme